MVKTDHRKWEKEERNLPTPQSLRWRISRAPPPELTSGRWFGACGGLP